MFKDNLQIPETGILISWFDLLISLSLAALLALVIVFVYRITHKGFNYERSFLVTLFMLPTIISLVMMLIGSNLALSLGMVGSLSIIRFRTVIKDSRDMVYLFYTIAVGLGCGTYNWKISIIATLFIAVLLYILYLLKFGTKRHAEYALVLKGHDELPEESFKKILLKHVSSVQIRSMDVKNDNWEVVYELRLFNQTQSPETNLIEELKTSHPGIDDVSLLSPQLSLPL